MNRAVKIDTIEDSFNYRNREFYLVLHFLFDFVIVFKRRNWNRPLVCLYTANSTGGLRTLTGMGNDDHLPVRSQAVVGSMIYKYIMHRSITSHFLCSCVLIPSEYCSWSLRYQYDLFP